jgi:hypothetical protein
MMRILHPLDFLSMDDELLLLLPPVSTEDNTPPLTRAEWERGCREVHASLRAALGAYTRRQVIALRPMARRMFAPQDPVERAALLDTITRAMPFETTEGLVGFQRRGNAVHGELLERLTRQFAIETGQVVRPTPLRMVAVPVVVVPLKKQKKRRRRRQCRWT